MHVQREYTLTVAVIAIMSKKAQRKKKSKNSSGDEKKKDKSKNSSGDEKKKEKKKDKAMSNTYSFFSQIVLDDELEAEHAGSGINW